MSGCKSKVIAMVDDDDDERMMNAPKYGKLGGAEGSMEDGEKRARRGSVDRVMILYIPVYVSKTSLGRLR